VDTRALETGLSKASRCDRRRSFRGRNAANLFGCYVLYSSPFLVQHADFGGGAILSIRLKTFAALEKCAAHPAG